MRYADDTRFPQSKVTIAISYSFIVTVFQLLIDSMLQEQLRLFFTLPCSVLLQVCYVFHDTSYCLKIYLCGGALW